MNTLPQQKAKTSVGSDGFGTGAGKMSAPGTNERAGGGALSIPHDQRNTGTTPAASQNQQRRVAHNEVHHNGGTAEIAANSSVGVPPRR